MKEDIRVDNSSFFIKISLQKVVCSNSIIFFLGHESRFALACGGILGNSLVGKLPLLTL